MKRRKVINGQLLLDVASAAQVLGCSERSLRARVARQLVPYRKLNSRIVFFKKDLDRFLDALLGVSVEEARANADRR